jgi:hypothetical protein
MLQKAVHTAPRTLWVTRTLGLGGDGDDGELIDVDEPMVGNA